MTAFILALFCFALAGGCFYGLRQMDNEDQGFPLWVMGLVLVCAGLVSLVWGLIG